MLGKNINKNGLNHGDDMSVTGISFYIVMKRNKTMVKIKWYKNVT